MTDRELYYNIYLFGNDLIEYQENETGKIVDRLINTWCEADPNTIEETKIRKNLEKAFKAHWEARNGWLKTAFIK